MSKEIKLVINGTNSLYMDSIVSLSTHRMLFDNEPTIGLCSCGELNAVLNIPNESLPKNASIVPYVREEGQLNWTKKSEFFIFNREIDDESETIKIVAYDAIYKAEAQYAQAGNQGRWPKKDYTVMSEIASRIGTTICDETKQLMNWQSGGIYDIKYPGIILEDNQNKPDGATTMREVAGYIAALYSGNWLIDNNGQLRLIQLGSHPPETYYIITEAQDVIVMGGFRLCWRHPPE